MDSASTQGSWMDQFSQDVRYSVRLLRKNAGFTIVAALTVALGIGANAAIFSILYGVLWKPLPYPEAYRIVRIWQAAKANGLTQLGMTEGQFIALRQHSSSFSALGAYTLSSVIVTRGGQAGKVRAASLTSGVLESLGIPPILGHSFRLEDEGPGNAPVTLLTDGFWRNWFNSDQRIIGQSVKINGQLFTVIGVLPPTFVMPEDFVGNDPVQILTPRVIHVSNPNLTNWNLQPIARLKPGIGDQRALTEVRVLFNRLWQDHLMKSGTPEQMGYSVRVLSLHEDLVGDVRIGLWILAGAVAVVLLIVCANVSSLLLARAAARLKEIAVRIALGATRMRIIRQLLTESIVISLIGGALGLALAASGMKMIVQLGAGRVPRLNEIALNVPVLLFTLAICIVAAFIFGVIPANQSSRLDLNQWLREGSRGSSAGGARARTYSLLVVAEVASAVVLVICAGLLLRSLVQLYRVDPGFNPKNVLSADVDLLPSRYADVSRVEAFWNNLIDRARELPGVTSASVTSAAPFTGGSGNTNFDIQGRPSEPNVEQHVSIWQVSPDYFNTLGIGLLHGRFFNDSDNASSAPAIVIDDVLANRYWPHQDVIGHEIRLYWGPTMKGPGPWAKIVGVVKTVPIQRLNEDPQPEAYMTLAQSQKIINDNLASTLVVRAAGAPSMLGGEVREQVRRLDPEAAVSQVGTMEQLLTTTLSQPQFYLVLLGLFAAVALVLAAMGIYGILANMVRQRMREIGIRVALGAARIHVFRLIVGRGMSLAAIGIAIGLAAAFGAAIVLRSLLFSIKPADPFTFVAVIALLSVVAFLACYIPARRAMRADPMLALRSE